MINTNPVPNRQPVQHRDKNEENSRTFGDNLNISSKNKEVIQYAFQNIRGFGTHEKHERALQIKQFIDNNHIDIMGMAEVNVNWRNLRQKNTLEQIGRKWYEHTRTMASFNSHNRQKGYSLPGGVASISTGPLSLRATERTHDKRHLGRWGSQRFQGKNGICIRFVSVYVPNVTKEHGEKKIFCQQQQALLHLKVSGAVLTTFWKDFWDQIDKWISKGEQLVIGGDWNEKVTAHKFLEPFQERGLLPAIQLRHGTSLPPTYNRGSKPIDEIFVSQTLDVIQAGYGEFGSTAGDHRPIWIDISKTTAIGTKQLVPAQRAPKRLRCKDPRLVKKYNYILHQELDAKGVFHRAHRLLQSFHTPLTIPEEKEFEKLDKLREKAMKKAEKQCRKLKMGAYQWTPELQRMRDKVKYLRLSLSRMRGCHIGARVLVNLAKKVKMNVEYWTPAQIKKELYNVTKTFEKAKKHHVQKRQTYLDDLATALAKQNKTTKASMVKQLTTLEEQRSVFRRLKIVNHKISNLSTSHITIKKEDGTREEISDPNKMDHAFCEENRKKYHQTENTCPFMTEPL